jgi:uncharacterized protein YndB with AHSA1/START domain
LTDLPPKALRFSTLVPADPCQVWSAWTTEAGVCTFFAPDCKIDLRPGGCYEMFFDLEAEPGLRGGEGCILLALDPMRMLSFTWNAPPEYPAIRSQRTHVMVTFQSVESNRTLVTLIHDGWGTSLDWFKVRNYFDRAWGKIVLPRLVKRFTEGPIDWGIH